MNAILTVSAILFPLITYPYISRVLMPEGVGKVSLAISVIAYFNLFAQLGIPTYGIKACAKVRDNREELSKTVHELLFINLSLSVLVYILLAIAIACVPKLRDEKLLYIIVSSTILLNSIGMEWLYQGLEEYSYITKRSLIFKGIALIAIFLLVKEESDYIIYAAISVFATSVPYICNFIHAWKYIDFKWIGGYAPQRHLKVIAIFFALACTTTIYTNLDNVMLGFMRTDAEVGLYSTAIKIKTLLVGIITSLGAVLLPRASYYVEKGMTDDFRNIINKAINYVLVVATPVTVLFIISASQCIGIIAGPAYDGAVVPMMIIMPTVLMIGLTNVLGIEVMVPTGREKTVLWSTVVGAITDIILNMILIPKLGAVGAAIGTLAAEGAVLLYQLIYLRDELCYYFKAIQWWKIIVSIIAAAAACLLIKIDSTSVFKQFVVCAGVFIAVYAVLMVLLRETFTLNCVDTVVNSKYFSCEKIEKYILWAYAIYVAFTISGGTTLVMGNATAGAIVNVIRYAMLALAACIIAIKFLKKEYSKRSIIIIGAVTVLIAVITYTSRDYNPIKYWVFIVAAYGIDLRRIAKTSFIAHVAILVTVVALSLAGLGGMVNKMFEVGWRDRESLGFDYVTTSSNLFFYCTVIWMFWRKEKATWYEILGMLAANIFLYKKTDTKSAFAFSLLAIVLLIITKLIPAIRNYKSAYKYLALAAPVVFPLGIIICTIGFNPDSALWQEIDRVLYGRLRLGKAALDTYGVSLFGKNITWVGGDGFLPDGTFAYNYVDSSYVQILLTYGIIFLLAVLVYFAVLIIRGGKKFDTYLLIAVVLIMAHATFDPQLIWIEYDVFLMGLAMVIGRQETSESNGEMI